ncbi:hypothetical protein [Ornithinimicrobium kibberense]|uniref:Uncharacterized protein n=1 Tax=Ornithinimicrobium kibberense TaxID=282060 RepID=A0ABV5UZF2_9MICO|nr:hypothetical protein [Ornithinimicrobium kibberense]
MTKVAHETYTELKDRADQKARFKKVQKALAHLQANPRHPGLQSHKYESMQGANGEAVWDSYVENNTPSAWRIFWHYGPGKGVLTVLMITPHP